MRSLLQCHPARPFFDSHREIAVSRAADRSRRPEAPSGTDAAVLVRFRRVGRDRFVGLEVKVALDGQAHRTAQGLEFGQADIAEFRLAETEVAQPEGEVGVVGIEFREQPGCA